MNLEDNSARFSKLLGIWQSSSRRMGSVKVIPVMPAPKRPGLMPSKMTRSFLWYSNQDEWRDTETSIGKVGHRSIERATKTNGIRHSYSWSWHVCLANAYFGSGLRWRNRTTSGVNTIYALWERNKWWDKVLIIVSQNTCKSLFDVLCGAQGLESHLPWPDSQCGNFQT